MASYPAAQTITETVLAEYRDKIFDERPGVHKVTEKSASVLLIGLSGAKILDVGGCASTALK